MSMAVLRHGIACAEAPFLRHSSVVVATDIIRMHHGAPYLIRLPSGTRDGDHPELGRRPLFHRCPSQESEELAELGPAV